MKTCDVTDWVPYGHDNAITLAELVYLSDMSERTIRDCIAKSRDLIINLQDGKGYFKPTEEERHLVEEWRAQMRSRIRELSHRDRQANKWLYK